MAAGAGDLRIVPVRMRRLVPLLALLVAFASAPPALAADPGPTPSGANLREAYPLHAKPSATPSSVAARPVLQRTPAPQTPEDGYDITPVILLFALVVGEVMVVVFVRRRRREGGAPWWDEGDAQDEPPSPMPLLAIFRPPEATPGQARTRGRFKGASPPDRTKAWTAEIVWRETDGESRFVVSARSAQDDDAVVLSSDPIAWPPRDAEEVAALEQVVSDLDSTMQRAGWSDLEPGAAWYARRFSWAPQNETDDPTPAHSPSASGKVDSDG